MAAEETKVGDLPEACLAHVIALTSPRDACRCAAVSPAFRAAADSVHVWQRFIPELDQRQLATTAAPGVAKATKKAAYLGLCDGGCRVWLEKASGAKCYALSARRLNLPWDDGEFSWRWTTHPLARFAEVAELVDCTCMEIHGRLRAAALTPATTYAAYLVYGTAEGHRGLSYPDQETAVAMDGRVLERHRVCLCPDDDETRKFRGAGLIAECSVAVAGGDEPRRRDNGWWEMEMGRLRTTTGAGGELEEEVVASFEVLGWYTKRGLLVEAIGFGPVR